MANPEQHHRPEAVAQASRSKERDCSPPPAGKPMKERCCECRGTNKTYCHQVSCRCHSAGVACKCCRNKNDCRNEFNPKRAPIEACEVKNPPPPELRHDTRPSNEGKAAAPVTDRLKLPSAKEKSKWNTFNSVLSQELERLLPSHIFETLSAPVIADKLTDILYSNLLKAFEVQKPAEKREVPVEKPNRRMVELRNEKKELKKARQVLHRSGCKNTAADRANSRRWFEVMHEHAALKRHLETKKSARFNVFQQRKFKGDPRSSAKQSLRRKLMGNPRFRAKLATPSLPCLKCQ